MTDDDRQLDADLRRVPFPETLGARLAAEALFDDAAIDAILGRVAMPDGLPQRVRSAVGSGPARPRSGAVDLARLVPPEPVRPADRAGRQPARRRPAVVRESLRMAAAAAAAFGVTLAGIEFSRWLAASRSDHRPGEVAALSRAAADGPGTGSAERRRTPVSSSTGRAASPLPDRPAQRGGDLSATPLLAEAEQSEGRVPADARPHPSGEAAAAGGRVVRGAPLRPLAPGRRSPEMHTVELPGQVRRAVPRSTAVDLAFEMAHGESPFVAPAADPLLAVDRPPLTLRTAGFDALLAGRSGRSEEPPRVEEIVAAMPAPPGLTAASGPPVRLGMHVVRSWRAIDGRPTLLLEVAAHAAGVPAEVPGGAGRAIRLILDHSAGGDGPIWPRICRGLAAVAGQLPAADRVTVLLCGRQPRVVVRDVDPSDLAALAADLEWLPAAASADLDAGLRLAALGDAADLTVVVSHTSTLDRGREEVREALAAWHRGLATAGGDRPPAATGREPRFIVLDPTAPDLARRGESGFGRTGCDAATIRRALLRQLLGRESLVAAACRLEVRFDPAAVSRYRLLGHRQSAVESLSEAPPPAVDLHAGETVRVVYEVAPRPGGQKRLASARLDWRSAAGDARSIEAGDDGSSADRTAAVPSPHGCELLLAAILGESLGRSAHVPRPGPPLAFAAGLAAAWQDRGDLTPFGAALIRCLGTRGAR